MEHKMIWYVPGKELNDFDVGDEVLYVPQRAIGDVHNRHCERGYVTYVGVRFVFCKFYNKDGNHRNINNAEACDPTSLYIKFRRTKCPAE